MIRPDVAKWGQTINYHEFFFGLRRDKAGNFYGTVSLASQGDKNAPTNLPSRGPRDVTDVLLSLFLTKLTMPLPDNVSSNDTNFLPEFPYLALPWRGYDQGHGKVPQ